MILGLLFASWFSPDVRAQTPVGAELLVPTDTTNKQDRAAVAMDGDGDFVVVWSSVIPAGRGSSLAIFARRYDAAGNPLGDAFPVHGESFARREHPAVAAEDAGDFVVVWTSYGEDSSGDGIFARRFDASGAPLDPEFRVNSTTPFDQDFPSVAMDADGDFVVAWQSPHDGSGVGVFAQRFDSSGAAVDGEFQVNTFTTDYQAYPSVAMDADGAFVVAWESQDPTGDDDQDGDGRGVFAQLFDSSGLAVDGELPVNSTTAGDQATPTAAMDADGDFVIAWESAAQDGSGNGIFAQRFDSTGAPQGDELQANSHTAADQTQPAAAMDDAGGFVLVWNSFGQDGSVGGIFGQLFDASGARRGSEFQVNTTAYLDQAAPAAAMDADGDFVVAWETGFQLGGDPGDVFAQRFSPEPPTLVVSVDIEPGRFPNKVNPQSNGTIHVAILTTSIADGDAVDFDAFDVDPSTLRFGPLGGAPKDPPHARDVDQDGDLDMTLKFLTRDTGIACGDTTATLTGETFDGESFEGTDSVLTQGCR